MAPTQQATAGGAGSISFREIAREIGLPADVLLPSDDGPETWPALEGAEVAFEARPGVRPATLEACLARARGSHVFIRRLYRADLYRLLLLAERSLGPIEKVSLRIRDARLPRSALRYFDDRDAYFQVLHATGEALVLLGRLAGGALAKEAFSILPSGIDARGQTEGGVAWSLGMRPDHRDCVEITLEAADARIEAVMEDAVTRGFLIAGGRRRSIALASDPHPAVRFCRALGIGVADPRLATVSGAEWIDGLRSAETWINEVELEGAPEEAWRALPNPLGLGWARRWPPLLRLDRGRFEAGLDRRLEGARVLLVRAPNRDFVYSPMRLLPFSTPALSGFLGRQGASVTQLDLSVEEGGLDAHDGERLAEIVSGRVGDRTFDLVGLSIDRTQDLQEGLALGAALRRRFASPVVVGGRGLGGEVRGALASVDYSVSGEGELPLLGLLSYLTDGGIDLAEIPGLCWRDDAGAIQANVSMEHDLDVLPRPDYGALVEAYRRAFPGEDIWIPYSWEMGCAFSCAYCSNYTERRVRFRSAAEVVDDLAALSAHLGVRHVAFFNNMLNMRPQLAREIYEAMTARGLELEWGDSARPSKMDPKVFPVLRDAGCVYLVWGVDAGSEKLQTLMRKKLDFEVVQTLLRESHAAGISNRINIIAGLPHEDEADLRILLELLDRLRPHMDAVYLSRYMYSPSSPVYRWPARYGLIKRGETFDEIGGLCWESKQRQIDDHHHRVVEKLRSLGLA
jgi:anaerobic magnesium-protoporphyrin IX monomethyl ester cyclase